MNKNAYFTIALIPFSGINNFTNIGITLSSKFLFNENIISSDTDNNTLKMDTFIQDYIKDGQIKKSQVLYI